jgi:hypothetical protein
LCWSLINIFCCLYLDIKEIGANHFQIDARSAMFALTASIGAESERRKPVALLFNCRKVLIAQFRAWVRGGIVAGPDVSPVV